MTNLKEIISNIHEYRKKAYKKWQIPEHEEDKDLNQEPSSGSDGTPIWE